MAAQPTTAELIEAIAQCKAEILSAIQAKGGQIDESTPFTEYAYAIETLPTGGGQYRIEIYDDMGMDYGSQVQPEQLGTGNNYYVYLYDTVNNEYKEDALDWDLTTDDDGTLIYSIADGDNGGFSHCKQMFTNLSDGGTTTLYAVEALDQDNVLASIEITITAP